MRTEKSSRTPCKALKSAMRDAGFHSCTNFLAENVSVLCGKYSSTLRKVLSDTAAGRPRLYATGRPAYSLHAFIPASGCNIPESKNSGVYCMPVRRRSSSSKAIFSFLRVLTEPYR